MVHFTEVSAAGSVGKSTKAEDIFPNRRVFVVKL